jgi:acetoin utilization deacetylase AcuC-like enzyme
VFFFQSVIMVGFVTSPRFVEHETGAHHPERPDRIRAICRAVREAGLVDSPDPFPDFSIDFGSMPQAAEKVLELVPTPSDEAMLRLVHTKEHIERVKVACEKGTLLEDEDTVVGQSSYEIALLSLGSAIRAGDAVMRGEVKRAFSAARPPGHHATPDKAMGFCLFANVAILARHIQHSFGVHKIAIVDFDVHHGNGTQACLEDDPSIRFISLHQDPHTCYPGSGFAWETGVGVGTGYTTNISFEPGATDEDYIAAMDKQAIPALDAFRPEILLVSAGFDAHRDDPLAQIRLSELGFADITQRLVQCAARHCGGRMVSVLEGGYNLKALGRSVVRHMIELAR